MSTPVRIPSERERNRELQRKMDEIQRAGNFTVPNPFKAYSSESRPLVNYDSMARRGIDGRTAFIREPISGDLNIDFIRLSREDLSVIVNGDSTFTFSNVPTDLNLRMYITIGTDTPPVIKFVTNAGTVTFDTSNLKRADELELEIKSADGINITVQKKTKKTKAAPSIPRKLYPHGISPSSIKVEWLAPENSGSGLKYELKYSKSRSTDSNGTPNGLDVNTILDITTLEKTVDNLDANTIYHFWVRATDDVGSSGWAYNYTDTDPNIPTAASLDFKVIPGYLSNFLNWKQPNGRNLKVVLKRKLKDILHDIIIPITDKLTVTTYTDSKNIEPTTNYRYYIDVYDETNSKIITFYKDVKTKNLPPPTRITLTTTGTNIHANIEIPPFVQYVDVELSQYDLKNVDDSFSERPVLRRLTRLLSDPQNTPITKTFTKEQLNTSTLYYVHARSNHQDKYYSSWSPDKSITTGRYLAPYDVSSLSIKVPSRGKTTMKWRSRGDYRGETFIITRYQQGKLGNVIVGSSIRDADPRDKDNRSDRVEISFTGQPTSGTWVYVVTPVNDTGVGGSDTYTVNFR